MRESQTGLSRGDVRLDKGPGIRPVRPLVAQQPGRSAHVSSSPGLGCDHVQVGPLRVEDELPTRLDEAAAAERDEEPGLPIWRARRSVITVDLPSVGGPARPAHIQVAIRSERQTNPVTGYRW